MRAGGITLAISALALAGCADAGNRPPSKPAQLQVRVQDRAAPGALAVNARLDTRRGDLHIPQPDGSVAVRPLHDSRARTALAAGQAVLVAPRAGTTASNGPPLSDERIAAFEAAALPVLPPAQDGAKPDAGAFLGAKVRAVKGDRAGDLVEVSAKLRQGVDDDTAFAYATCALTAWAAGHDAAFARHIRTVHGERNGTMTTDAVFTVSKTRPVGLMVVDVKETLRECKSRGIPAA